MAEKETIPTQEAKNDFEKQFDKFINTVRYGQEETLHARQIAEMFYYLGRVDENDRFGKFIAEILVHKID